MELNAPSASLVIWQTLMFSGVFSFIIAWVMILITNKLDATSKLVWLLGTLFLPIIGPLIFFLKFSFLKKA
jgi:hypothetical protein